MLYLLKNFSDPFCKFLTEDPVRPDINVEKRLGKNKDVFILMSDDNEVESIACVSYQNIIPVNETELFDECDKPTFAIIYSIWSYKYGAGKKLMMDNITFIKENYTHIKRYITFCPKKPSAYTFNVKNGASLIHESKNFLNFEYKF
jgi:hypothetical protein